MLNSNFDYKIFPDWLRKSCCLSCLGFYDGSLLGDPYYDAKIESAGTALDGSHLEIGFSVFEEHLEKQHHSVFYRVCW